MYDLLIKGGTVLDPSQNLHAKHDIAVRGGLVEALGEDIASDQAKEVLDASRHFVTPGLIDLHVHVFSGISHYGIDADAYSLAQGITTVVDAGSSGADTFEGFRTSIADTSLARIYAFLNVSSIGMISLNVGELEDLRFVNVERAIQVCEHNRNIIHGVKVRLSRPVVGENGLEPLYLALRIAEAVKMPVMVDAVDISIPLPDILKELRNGDILTHCFHGFKEGILDEEGNVLDAVRGAIRRGIILDVGHGRGSFSFDVAQKALSQGMMPDTISSDLHYYNVFGPVYSLLVTVSKFFHLGLSLDQIIAKVTVSPAKVLGMDKHLGNLKQGSIADIAVLELKEGSFRFEDAMGKVVAGRKLLEPAAVVKGGRVHASRLALSGRK